MNIYKVGPRRGGKFEFERGFLASLAPCECPKFFIGPGCRLRSTFGGT